MQGGRTGGTDGITDILLKEAHERSGVIWTRDKPCTANTDGTTSTMRWGDQSVRVFLMMTERCMEGWGNGGKRKVMDEENQGILVLRMGHWDWRENVVDHEW